MDLDKIEAKIDTVAAGATEISMGFGGVQFKTMMELMQFAKLMAVSGAAVPAHLRGNPGACLAICTRALRFGFDPFALAEHSYLVPSKKTGEETMAYDSTVIHAVIEAHAPIKGRLQRAYKGEGDALMCIATGISEDGEELIHESKTLGERRKAIGKNEYGKTKGSPLWDVKPELQLWYDTRRDWCRSYYPEILLGWYDKDEFEEYAKAASATDITPPPASALKERLNKGKKGSDGFSEAHVEKHLPPPTETPMAPVEVVTEKPEAVVVEAKADAPPAAPEESDDDLPAALRREVPMARGKRILAALTKTDDIADLKITIGDELTSKNRSEWFAACDARAKALEANAGKVA